MRAVLLILTFLVAGPAYADTFLTTPSGMTLYVYSKDYDGKPTCPDVHCAPMWPPYLVDHEPHGPGWSVVRRDNGAEQWAYKGKPLYTFSFDTKPGDAKGDAFNGGEWWAVRIDQPKASAPAR